MSLPPDLDALDAVWHVRRAIDALPRDEATIVRLQHLEGLTHNEISEQLGIALGTVKSRSHRAHRKLAALLGHLRRRPMTDRPTNEERERLIADARAGALDPQEAAELAAAGGRPRRLLDLGRTAAPGSRTQSCAP